MPSKTEIAKLIERAYYALDVACDRTNSDAQRLITELVILERHQEQGHRRFAPPGHRHAFSAETITRYFVVRAVLEGDDPIPTSWADLAQLSPRLTLGCQLQATLRERHPHPFADLAAYPPCVELMQLNYQTDLT